MNTRFVVLALVCATLLIATIPDAMADGPATSSSTSTDTTTTSTSTVDPGPACAPACFSTS